MTFSKNEHESERTPPNLILVIADDLTGSADTGIQFGNHGVRARVWLRRPSATLEGVHIVDTNSRGSTPATARSRVRAWSRLTTPDARVYKKIDSTLRGNVGAEIEAALRGCRRRIAIVAPAFPDNRRTTVNGIQLVGGVPVHETTIANDPAHPMRAPTIAAALAEQTRLPITRIDIASVRGGATSLANEVKGALSTSREPQICIVDAELNSDLALIAGAIELLGSIVLPVGSAGLAHFLAKKWLHNDLIDDQPLDIGRRVLLVSGSQNPTTLEQIRILSTELDIDPCDLFSHSPRFISACLQENAVIAVSANAPKEWSANQIARTIGLRVRGIIRATRPDALIVTGGDTARGILDLLGAQAIDLIAEVASGVPHGRIVGGIADGLPIITKAGGFGQPDVFIRAFGYLRNGTASGEHLND